MKKIEVKLWRQIPLYVSKYGNLYTTRGNETFKIVMKKITRKIRLNYD